MHFFHQRRELAKKWLYSLTGFGQYIYVFYILYRVPSFRQQFCAMQSECMWITNVCVIARPLYIFYFYIANINIVFGDVLRRKGERHRSTSKMAGLKLPLISTFYKCLQVSWQSQLLTSPDPCVCRFGNPCNHWKPLTRGSQPSTTTRPATVVLIQLQHYTHHSGGWE